MAESSEHTKSSEHNNPADSSTGNSLSHVDPQGRARMVDVTAKAPTLRRAVASCVVRMKPETVRLISDNAMAKGDVLAVARVAGIQAAKQTSTLIPLCHPLNITSVAVHFDVGVDSIAVEAEVDVLDRTGVEMEAMTACAVAALTIYDMGKAVDRAMVIDQLVLEEKSGGRSGVYRRSIDNV